MALTRETFAGLDAGANIAAGRIFIYKTPDAQATVEGDGYFDVLATEQVIGDDDLLMVISTNATPFTQLYRATVTPGDVAIAIALPDLIE